MKKREQHQQPPAPAPTRNDMAKALDTVVKRDGESPEDHQERQIAAYQETLHTAEQLNENEPNKFHAQNLREVKQELTMLINAPLATRYRIKQQIMRFGFDQEEAVNVYRHHASLLDPAGTDKANARRMTDAEAELQSRHLQGTTPEADCPICQDEAAAAAPLYVAGRWYSRGDEGPLKFRIHQADIEAAVLLRGKADDAQDAFADQMLLKYPECPWAVTLLCLLVTPQTSPAETPDFAKGFGVFGEESEYGIGPTKDAALLAFAKLKTDDADQW